MHLAMKPCSLAGFLSAIVITTLLRTVEGQDGGKPVVVAAPAGVIQGKSTTDAQGVPMLAFRGIPYALPPTGDARFAKPKPIPKSDQQPFIDATKGGSVCQIPTVMAAILGSEQGEEDCLYLNVYLKEIPRGGPKPVLVYVHGGGFFVGSGKEVNPGSFVTRHDVVVVTPNYRLGVLGGLALGGVAPGNVQLWDVTLALRWVRDNIAAFGGDPEQVTLAGESAGSALVSLVSLSAHAAGLFRSLWMMSGAATSAFALAREHDQDTLKLASKMGCFGGAADDRLSSSEKEEVISCLRTLPYERFAAVAGFPVDAAEFVPVVDGDFLPETPAKLLKNESYLTEIGFYKRTYLVGLDNNENGIMKNHADNAAMMARAAGGEEAEQALGKRAINFYVTSFLDMPARFASGTVTQELVMRIASWYNRRYGPTETLGQLSGHLAYLVPNTKYLDVASKSTRSWLLHFNHYPAYMTGRHRGMVHGMDLMYWLDVNMEALERQISAGMEAKAGFSFEDLQVKDAFSKIVATFVKTGEVSGSVDGEWPEYSAENAAYLDLTAEGGEVRNGCSGPDPMARKLWRELVPKWRLQIMKELGMPPPHDEL